MTLPYKGINTPFSSISKEANNTRPKCARCSTPEHPLFFNHVENMQGKYVWICVGCSRVISDTEINYAEDNLNAPFRGQMSSTALAKQQQQDKQQQQEMSQREQRFANAGAAARPRVTNGLGATTYTTNIDSDDGPSTTTIDYSKHSVFQSFDPRENLIRERKGSQHHKPGTTIPVKDLDSLDRSLLQEYPHIQIREVHELPRTAPTDKAIVSKDLRAPKPYARYSENSNNDKDP